MRTAWVVVGVVCALLGSAWPAVGHAGKPGPRAVYFPPDNMSVSCTGTTTVIANVPSRTKQIEYNFYKPDNLYYNYKLIDPSVTFDAYIPSQGGPGWPGPLFPYSTEVGRNNVQLSTPFGATYVWAAAVTKLGGKPLAWGFATCNGAAAIKIIISSGATTIMYDNGAYTAFL